MDTGNDYRFIMAEYAVSRLKQRIRQWGMPWPLNKSKTLEIIEALERDVKKLRYSYLPPELLLESETLKELTSKSKELATLVLPKQQVKMEQKHRLALAEIKWALSILIGLPLRIKLGVTNHPVYAVDVVGVEVTRVTPLEGTDNLKVTRASTGTIVFTIVTNIQDIKPGEVRAAALLPPVEFHGVISEAMYSSDPLPRELIGKRVPRKYLGGELSGKILSILGKR